jgi:hypothetical protein
VTYGKGRQQNEEVNREGTVVSEKQKEEDERVVLFRVLISSILFIIKIKQILITSLNLSRYF